MARAFDIILHQGATGRIYNIGGSNEMANLDVARDIIRQMGLMQPPVPPPSQQQQVVHGKKEDWAPPPPSGDGERGGDGDGDGDGEEPPEMVVEEAGGEGAEAAAVAEAKAEQAAMARYITYVEDRAFNDARYDINSSQLKALGWREEVSWDEGLRKTIAWYRDLEKTSRWGNIEGALVAHPSHPL